MQKSPPQDDFQNPYRLSETKDTKDTKKAEWTSKDTEFWIGVMIGCLFLGCLLIMLVPLLQFVRGNPYRWLDAVEPLITIGGVFLAVFVSLIVFMYKNRVKSRTEAE